MEYDHTISGLQRKRVEIAQDIERNGRELERLRGDLVALDAALRVMGVVDTPAPPKLREKHFKRGEIPRLIYGELRISPKTIEHLVNRAIAMKGKDGDSVRVRKSVTRSVQNALVRLEGEGRIRTARESAGVLIWEMVER